MASFSDQAIEEIRARTDIVELISQRVPLKRSGADFKACCPFHHEKTPSFIVSPSRRAFHCFGCGLQGDVFKFLMLSDGMTFPDAVRALAERCGVALESADDSGSRLRKRLMALHEDIAAFYRRCLLSTKEAKVARDYLARRRIDAETAEKFRIGYAPEMRNVLVQWAERHSYSLEEMVEAGFLSPPRSAGDSFYDRFSGRLMFPICDQNGHVVAFSGRLLDDSRKAPKYYNSTETPIFRKSRVLYGLSFAKRAITRDPRRTALICEGQIDVIRCHSCGFDNAVASQGTAFTADHVSLLKSYADGAVLAFDGDGAGMKAAIRTGRLFLAAGMPVQAALLPEGEDPDSLLRDRPRSDFQALLDNPVSLVALHVRAFKAAGGTGNMEALSRATSEIFETAASATKAVFRSFMLQEAAELLSIPQDALEKDFSNFLADRERRAAHSPANNPAQGSRAQAPASASVSAPATVAAAAPALAHADAPIPTQPRPPAPPPDATPPPAEPAANRRMRVAETPLIAIADVLVKATASPRGEAEEIARFAREWLPPLPTDNAAASIVAAALDDIVNASDTLGALSASSAETRALIAYLAGRPSPALQSGMTLLETMQELVFRAWLDYIRRTRSTIDPAADGGSKARLLLSTAIRRLESATDWEARSSLIAQLR
ncbi:MAG: DNA primase [Kiritimatiellae bacterium]|nr:DNA primase [Kiritimatiellia bacterium]